MHVSNYTVQVQIGGHYMKVSIHSLYCEYIVCRKMSDVSFL